MRNRVLAILMLAASFPASAQWRLDADVRLGVTNIDHTIPWESHGLGIAYFDAFSFGADVNIGRELKRGWALYSGLTYDLMRFNGCDIVGHVDPKEIIEHPGMHSFSFITVPVKVEYRFLKNIIRPYAGLGASYMCAEHKNPSERNKFRFSHDFSHNRIVPTAMFGLNIEYKRFIVGFSKRIDLMEFMSIDDLQNTWRLSQTTAKIGFRIF